MDNERQTGATDAELEQATYQWLATCGPVDDDTYSSAYRAIVNCAECLIRPDQVITDAARVPTDDELAAMRLMVNARLVPSVGPDVWRDAVQVVRAYLERQR